MQCTAAAGLLRPMTPRGLADTVVPLSRSTTFESDEKPRALILVRLWRYISHVIIIIIIIIMLTMFMVLS